MGGVFETLKNEVETQEESTGATPSFKHPLFQLPPLQSTSSIDNFCDLDTQSLLSDIYGKLKA